MPILDFLTTGNPQAVLLKVKPITGTKTDAAAQAKNSLYFQYWPDSLQDAYGVNYAEHMIPGGSHPLYQWVGGTGRTISFTAVFTSEINTKRFAGRASSISALSSTDINPSDPYTVNVEAALAKLKAWMRPDYHIDSNGAKTGSVSPPPILQLMFSDSSGINGIQQDEVDVILKAAPITIESWFPDGQIRVATVQLTFSEIIQTNTGNQGSVVKFRGRWPFERLGEKYSFKNPSDAPFIF